MKWFLFPTKSFGFCWFIKPKHIGLSEKYEFVCANGRKGRIVGKAENDDRVWFQPFGQFEAEPMEKGTWYLEEMNLFYGIRVKTNSKRGFFLGEFAGKYWFHWDNENVVRSKKRIDGILEDRIVYKTYNKEKGVEWFTDLNCEFFFGDPVFYRTNEEERWKNGYFLGKLTIPSLETIENEYGERVFKKDVELVPKDRKQITYYRHMNAKWKEFTDALCELKNGQSIYVYGKKGKFIGQCLQEPFTNQVYVMMDNEEIVKQVTIEDVIPDWNIFIRRPVFAYDFFMANAPTNYRVIDTQTYRRGKYIGRRPFEPVSTCWVHFDGLSGAIRIEESKIEQEPNLEYYSYHTEEDELKQFHEKSDIPLSYYDPILYKEEYAGVFIGFDKDENCWIHLEKEYGARKMVGKMKSMTCLREIEQLKE